MLEHVSEIHHELVDFTHQVTSANSYILIILIYPCVKINDNNNMDIALKPQSMLCIATLFKIFLMTTEETENKQSTACSQSASVVNNVSITS